MIKWEALDKPEQPVREAVSYRGLFTASWFGVREKHCSRLKIYDRLRASEQAERLWGPGFVMQVDFQTGKWRG